MQQNPLPLRGRDDHIAAINATLQTVVRRSESKVLLMQDEPGTGKTRLLLLAAHLARKAGFSVVTGLTPVPAPRPGVALELADVPARPGGGRGGAASPGRSDPLHDLGTRLCEALERGPVLVVLDDLHAVEMRALMVLRDLVARLPARPILWFLAFGSEDSGQSRGLADLFRGWSRVEQRPKLGALAGEPLRQLVADHLGAMPDPDVVALAEGIGGNPRAVIELMLGLVEDGDVYVADGRASLVASGHKPINSVGRVRVPPGVPARFAAIFRQNLRSLSPVTANVLKLAAILGSPFAPMDLTFMLDKSPAELLPALDEAVSHGILVCLTNEFAFRSDPIWRVILDSIPKPMVSLLHKQAATGLLGQPDGADAAALHLVHVTDPGDNEAVRIISEAAARLLTSDPATAASLALRGLERLKPEQEGYIRLATTAVEALVRACDVASAITTAEETVERAASLGEDLTQSRLDEIATLRSWLSTALLLAGRVHDAGRVASDALAACPNEPGQRERAELVRLAVDFLTDDGAAIGRAERILTDSIRTTGAMTAGALTVRAWERWRDGQADEAMDLLNEASDADRRFRDLQPLDPRWMLASMATKTGQLEKAAEVAEAAARGLPEPHAAAVAAILIAPVHLARGQLVDADCSARAGIEMLGDQCPPLLAPPAWYVRAVVALRRGSLAVAEEHLDVMERSFPPGSARPWRAMRFLLTAQLARATRGAAAATDILAGIRADTGAQRELILEDPTAAACCVRWALEAGAPDLAKMVVETARALQADNQDLRVLRAGLLHADGLLSGDPDMLAEAGCSHLGPWAKGMAAEDRAWLFLHRDERDAAIAQLEWALDTYSAIGAERDTARVRADLRQLGVRRRHWKHAKRPVSGWDSLTGAERRVADLVANGLTNREVANQLFVSPHTVGFHLRQVYRKLDLRSRKQLIRYISSA